MLLPRPGAMTMGWRKSSYSLGNGECIEVVPCDGGVAIRDSKNPDEAALYCSPVNWKAFLSDIDKMV
jgi:hypothetical protein